MAKKKTIPQYTSVERKGIQYYRTRILDADGKQVSLYATTCEELYEKQLAARRQVQEILFHRQHPTVAEYCEKWLMMQSAKVSAATLKGYTSNMRNYVIKPMGDMYLEEVTADDIRLALVPLSKKSEGLYNKVNMLIKCVFYSAERSQLLEDNPCAGISGKGGEASTEEGCAERPAGSGASGDHQRVAAIPLCNDWPIRWPAPGRSPCPPMGLCIPGCSHSVHLGAASMASGTQPPGGLYGSKDQGGPERHSHP